MNKKAFPILMVLYTLFLFFLLLTSVTVLMSALRREREQREFQETAEPIYVYLDRVTEQTEAQETLPVSRGYWVREYGDKIGIFYPDGSLYRILDTYVKTLPKSDQGQLKEGIYLENERQLYQLIEDYS